MKHRSTETSRASRIGTRPSSLRSESGTALIEFALVLPLILVLAMGMLDFGRAFHTKSLLDQAAREGARAAVITSPDLDVVTSRVNAILAPAGVAATTVSVTGPTAGSYLDSVYVATTFTFVTPGIYALVGGDYGNTLSLSSSCVMRHESASAGVP